MGVLVDTHCHLDAIEFDADRDVVIEAMRAKGVGAVVVPAVSRDTFDRVRDLANANRDVWFTLGIHPLYVEHAEERDLEVLGQALEECRSHPRLLGVGEIGLDHFVAGLDRARQERFFVAQLQLARALDLPVILHVRRAQDQVLKHLRRVRPRSGIAHAFNGSPQQARAFLDLGFALGFGGAMTFERARRIRGLAAQLPQDALVLETDSPDIAPSWRHPGRNEPAELGQIAAVLADLRNDPLEHVIAFTQANARRVLPRLLCDEPSIARIA